MHSGIVRTMCTIALVVFWFPLVENAMLEDLGDYYSSGSCHECKENKVTKCESSKGDMTCAMYFYCKKEYPLDQAFTACIQISAANYKQAQDAS